MKAPVIGEIVGDYEYNRPNRVLEWRVPTIDEANPEGSLEFSVSDVSNADGFFPVRTYFKSEKTLAQVDASLSILCRNIFSVFFIFFGRFWRLLRQIPVNQSTFQRNAFSYRKITPLFDIIYYSKNKRKV